MPAKNGLSCVCCAKATLQLSENWSGQETQVSQIVYFLESCMSVLVFYPPYSPTLCNTHALNSQQSDFLAEKQCGNEKNYGQFLIRMCFEGDTD